MPVVDQRFRTGNEIAELVIQCGMPQVGTILPRSMEDANEEINQIFKSEFQRAKGSLLMEKVVKELLDEKTMTQERLIGILGGH